MQQCALHPRADTLSAAALSAFGDNFYAAANMRRQFDTIVRRKALCMLIAHYVSPDRNLH